MPKFESSIGSKNFSGSSLKEFDIPDETDEDKYAALPQIDPGAIKHYNNIIQAQRAQRNANLPVEQHVMTEEEEIEKQIKMAREAKRTGKERLNDGAKRRIEMLVGMTRTTREVDLEGNIFILQTLKSKEMREAIMLVSEFDGTVQSPFEMRRQLLARSLIQVAGVEIDQFVGSPSLDSKLGLIDELDESLLNRLYDEYLALDRESKNKFSIKNAVDAKEVVEDLKK